MHVLHLKILAAASLSWLTGALDHDKAPYSNLRRHMESTGECFYVLLESKQNILTSRSTPYPFIRYPWTVSNANGDVTLEIEDSGSVKIYAGTPNDRGAILWKTPESTHESDYGYYIDMQGDGNLIVHHNRAEEYHKFGPVWKSDSEADGDDQNYQFGITCDLARVQIRKEAGAAVIFDAPASDLTDPPVSPPSTQVPVTGCFVPLLDADYLVSTYDDDDYGITSGITTAGDLFLEMTPRGALEVRIGFFRGSSRKIWESFKGDLEVPYGTMFGVTLQGDAHLLVRNLMTNELVYRSNTVEPSNSGPFQFGATCDATHVQIRSQLDGRIVFQESTMPGPPPTNHAPVSPPSGSLPCRYELLSSGSSISSGQTIVNEEGGINLKFGYDSSLGIYPNGSFVRIWQTENVPVRSSKAGFTAWLQHDAHLLVQDLDDGKFVWRSLVVRDHGEYAFGITCDLRRVQIWNKADGSIVFDVPS